MNKREAVYIGLGSNLANPRSQLENALQELDNLPETMVTAASSLYESAPMGPADQPDYLNAVACIATALEPLALLDALQALELVHQRLRQQHWGPRTLDLDILLYGERVIDEERLQVPHPHMHKRSFVLQPLLEISPEIAIPGRGAAAGWLPRCEALQIRRLSD
jgi:2-amino-4-hydroxy-6-hydroxymethyldihydropteridine diphosphokinase